MKIISLILASVVALSAQESTQENQSVKITKEYLAQKFKDYNCFSSRVDMSSCLRAINNLMQYVSKSNVYLLRTEQLDDVWVKYQKDNQVFFESKNLVVAELSKESKEGLNKLAINDYPEFLKLRRLMDTRLEQLGTLGYTSAEIQSAFSFIIDNCKSDEEAKVMASIFYTAQLRELHKDPYAYLNIKTAAQKTTYSPSGYFLWNGSHFVINRVRPGSGGDRKGFYAGVLLEKIGDTIVTPQNIKSLFAQQQKDNTLVHFRGVDGKIIIDNLDSKNESDLPGVYTYDINSFGYNVAVLEILSFSVDNVCENVKSALAQINKKNPHGLIIDLRDNGGGSLYELTCIGGALFGKGLSMGWDMLFPDAPLYKAMKASREDVQNHFTTSDRVLDDMPVTVLVNAKSVSASEVFTGFAKYGFTNVWVVGQKTYGKGIGQGTYKAKIGMEEIEGMEVTTTYSRYYMPNSETYHLVGVDPDFVVESPITNFKTKYIERFRDVNGDAFGVETKKFKPNRKRERAKNNIEICSQNMRQKQITNPTIWRWFQDQQLRKAFEVTVCQNRIGE